MSHDYDFDPSDLDEFLVEYVDGTMDPVVREAFEEFLRVYPEVRYQIECLTNIRTELCKLGDDCRCQAPPGFQERLRRQLAGEMSGIGTLEQLTPQLNLIALAFSITILALSVGLSNVADSESLADQMRSEPATTEVAPWPALDDRDIAQGQSEPVPLAPLEPKLSLSHANQLVTASAFAAAFDRPVLMSVRKDFVAMKPAMALSP